MIKKICYERRVYESVDDNSLSKAISQKTDEKNKSCNKGLTGKENLLSKQEFAFNFLKIKSLKKKITYWWQI